MRLLIYFENGLAVQKLHIASFVIFDSQSIPAVLGIEYRISEGIVRTFSDVSSPDFYDVLQRSGVQISGFDRSCTGSFVLSVPFLGKGVLERTDRVSKLLAINDAGKYLLAVRKNAGVFEVATFGDERFETFVQTWFG